MTLPLIGFLDETGDHSLNSIDTDFPVFVLTLVVCNAQHYTNAIEPAVRDLKQSACGSTDVILHSRDIRKQHKDFTFLANVKLRIPFLAAVSTLMSQAPYTVIAAGIRKKLHLRKYGRRAHSPYDLSLMFILERLHVYMTQRGETAIHLIAESRGRNEDNQLRAVFNRIRAEGTDYRSVEEFAQVSVTLEFRDKAANCIGTQLADLIGYPLARKILDPRAPNPAYDVVAPKLLKRGVYPPLGFKVFPSPSVDDDDGADDDFDDE